MPKLIKESLNNNQLIDWYQFGLIYTALQEHFFRMWLIQGKDQHQKLLCDLNKLGTYCGDVEHCALPGWKVVWDFLQEPQPILPSNSQKASLSDTDASLLSFTDWSFHFFFPFNFIVLRSGGGVTALWVDTLRFTENKVMWTSVQATLSYKCLIKQMQHESFVFFYWGTSRNHLSTTSHWACCFVMNVNIWSNMSSCSCWKP